ncbi:hypothetical protein ACHAQJ_009697 [Trichoderma viride]
MGRKDNVYPGKYYAWVQDIPSDVLTSRAHVDFQQTVYTNGEYRLDMQVKTRDGFRNFQAQINKNSSRQSRSGSKGKQPSVSCILVSVEFVQNEDYKDQVEVILRKALIDAAVPREGFSAQDYMIRVDKDGTAIKVEPEKKTEKR